MHLVERLTRLDPDTVAYEFTITDPTVYTAPYTVMMPFRRTDGPLFEYACHEGNYGLYGILPELAGSRAWGASSVRDGAGVSAGRGKRSDAPARPAGSGSDAATDERGWGTP